MMDTEIWLSEYNECLAGIKWSSAWDYVWPVHTNPLSLWLFHLCWYSLGHQFFFTFSNSLTCADFFLTNPGFFFWHDLCICSYYFPFLTHSPSFVFCMYFSCIADYFNHTLNSINSEKFLCLSGPVDFRLPFWEKSAKQNSTKNWWF